MSDTHISRGWFADGFAPDCGCTLLDCKHVSAAEGLAKGCDQHDPANARTIRSQHPAIECDQEFARTALPEDPDYVAYGEADVLGEDDYGFISGPPESGDIWETFDRSNPRHMAAYEKTKATGRIAFLEVGEGE